MALCDCGYEFGFDPDHASCPKCGASIQVRVVARPDAIRAVAHVFPPTVTATSNFGDGSYEILTSSYGHRSTTRRTVDGVLSHEYEGRPARNEEDVPQACESLMEALKLEGVVLVAKFKTPGGRESGIDATATTTTGDVINVQVVGVRQEQLLATLGRTGTTSSSASTSELADDVCKSVEAKRDAYPPAVRRDNVLLVDAIRSPGHTMPEVLDVLRVSPRIDVLRSTGYQAVWLAGSTTGLTSRLDS